MASVKLMVCTPGPIAGECFKFTQMRPLYAMIVFALGAAIMCSPVKRNFNYHYERGLRRLCWSWPAVKRAEMIGGGGDGGLAFALIQRIKAPRLGPHPAAKQVALSGCPGLSS